MMTTKQMFEVASNIFRNIPEILGGLKYKDALKLAEPENLKRAFEVVLSRDDEEEVAKFLAKRDLEIVEYLEEVLLCRSRRPHSSPS